MPSAEQKKFRYHFKSDVKFVGFANQQNGGAVNLFRICLELWQRLKLGVVAM